MGEYDIEIVHDMTSSLPILSLAADADSLRSTAVGQVLGQDALLISIFEDMLTTGLLPTLGVAACSCRRLHVAVEDAALRAVRNWVSRSSNMHHSWADVGAVPSGHWSAHWALICSVRGECSEQHMVLTNALYASNEEWTTAKFKCLEVAERVVGSLLRNKFSFRCLGVHGPKSLIPLQRSLLHRLVFDAGALKMFELARLNVGKATGSEHEVQALLDLAELLNLRAYTRTYVSRKAYAAREMKEAFDMARRAKHLCGQPASARVHRILGRTLASAAHSILLGVMDDEIRELMLPDSQSAKDLFHEALAEHESAVALAREDVSAGTALGTCFASLAECWYCIASSGHAEDDPVFRSEGYSVAQALHLFRESVDVFIQRGLNHSLEFADALKDFGKTLINFDEDRAIFEEPYDNAEDMLQTSFRLHVVLLGQKHPRTKNVKRLRE